MSDTPYIGFGNDTLAQLPKAKIGGYVLCPHCRQSHILKGGKDDNGVETDLLLFFNCGENTYLAGVGGKLTAGIKSDVSGSIELWP